VELEMQNEELRRVEAERSAFLDLYEFAPVGYLILDDEQKIRMSNLKAAELLRTYRQDLAGRPLLGYVLREDQDLAHLALRRLQESGVAQACEFRVQTRNPWPREGKDPCWVRMEASLDDASAGWRLPRIVLSDVTERRRAEENHRALERQIHQLQRMEVVGRLAGGIAHEMNNVLAVIMSVVGMLKLDRGDTLSLADMIETACVRGRDLTLGLLACARKDVGERVTVDLNREVRDVAVILRATTLEKVRVDLDLDPRDPSVFAEPSTVTTILMNLCGNALDAMPEGGKLACRTRCLPTGRVLLSVEDTGTGMPVDVANHALEAFFTTKGPGKGAGLGLSIVHGLVQSHGGDLRIQSAMGSGTRVEISLPVVAGPAGPVAAVQETPSLGSLDLLLVDDDVLVRETLPALLVRAGHRVRTASSGEDAIRLLKEGGAFFDAVILDMRMPDMDGLETLRRMRDDACMVPVLLHSGCLDEAARAQAQGLPGTALLAKPATLSQLLGALGRLLGPRSLPP
jgi:signal transduction histidine kinase/ActR/RegA family two-component response regulator